MGPTLGSPVSSLVLDRQGLAGYGMVLQGRGVSVVTPLHLTQNCRASVHAAGRLAALAASQAIATGLELDGARCSVAERVNDFDTARVGI